MTNEEALRRIIEHADLIHRVVDHEEVRPSHYLLVEADDELFDYLATFKAEIEDLEPSHGADQLEGDDEDLEPSYGVDQPESDGVIVGLDGGPDMYVDADFEETQGI